MSTMTLDAAVDVLEAPEQQVVQDPELCDFRPCGRRAVTAVTFKGLPEAEHSHVCATHEHLAREFYDVDKSSPLPCPWTHVTHGMGVWNWAPKLEG